MYRIIQVASAIQWMKWSDKSMASFSFPSAITKNCQNQLPYWKLTSDFDCPEYSVYELYHHIFYVFDMVCKTIFLKNFKKFTKVAFCAIPHFFEIFNSKISSEQMQISKSLDFFHQWNESSTSTRNQHHQDKLTNI